MATCKNCGTQYSIMTARGLGSGLCNACVDEGARRAQADATAKTLAEQNEAKVAVKTFAIAHSKDSQVILAGAAFWNTSGTIAGSVVASLVFGSLSGAEHRTGIIAITHNELLVLDFGMIVGEDLTLSKLKSLTGSVSCQRYALSDLTAEVRSPERGTQLVLRGSGFSLIATFPIAFEPDNPTKPHQIADAIRTAKTSPCPPSSSRVDSDDLATPKRNIPEQSKTTALRAETPSSTDVSATTSVAELSMRDDTKAKLCFFGGMPIFLLGLCTVTGAPGLSLLCGFALAGCLAGAIKWRYHEVDPTGTTYLAMFGMGLFAVIIVIGSLVTLLGS